MAEITIYTVENCPKCEQLKSSIPDKDYQVKNMSDPEVLTYLRCHEIFTMTAPVLQVNDQFFTTSELFKDGTLQIIDLSVVLSEAFREDVDIACERLLSEGWDDSADTVRRLYEDNVRFQSDLKNIKALNDDLMEHCNELRKREKNA